MIEWDEIKGRHPIEDELQKRGFKLRRSGTGFLMKCPLHNEQKGESFSIDVRKQLWKCFGKCQCGGDVIKLVMELDEVDALTAAEVLEGRSLRDDPAHKHVPRKPRIVPPKEDVEPLRELPQIVGIEPRGARARGFDRARSRPRNPVRRCRRRSSCSPRRTARGRG